MKYVVLLFLLLVAFCDRVMGQVEGQFIRPDSVLSFGNAVGIAGDQVLVAYHIPNFYSIKAYAESGNQWGEIGEVEALEGDPSQVFGSSLAANGEWAIVGALAFDYNGATNGGIAYIFQRSGDNWSGVMSLTPSDIQGQDEFGLSVGINGDLAIVGSHKEDAAGTNTGSGYIFRNEGGAWVEEAKIYATDGFETGRLGYSVSISGDYAIMGGPLEIISGAIVGSAYIFERENDNWIQAARLVADQPSVIENFGWDVVINGDVAMVGASGANGAEGGTGAVYVYNRVDGVWTLTQKLIASDGVGSAFFGATVDFDGDCAVIGSYGSDKAYVFLYDGTSWREEAMLTGTNGEMGGGYGFDVSVENGNAVIGTLGIFVEGIGGGGAYVYNNLCGAVATSNEMHESGLSANRFVLHQNYPNPFGNSTTIQYDLLQAAHVQLTVYNILGQEIAHLVEGFQSSGTYLVTWDKERKVEPATGIYLYTLDIDGVRVATRKMVMH